MTTDLLFKNFHLLADTPGGVKKLRQLILQLAVQGRLVPQNPDDPPANVLLQQIKAEKQRLIKEGKIKQQKPLPEIKPDEVPYDLPQGWEWVRLGTGFYIEMGQSPKSQFYNKSGNGLPFYQGKADFEGTYPTPRNWCTKPSKKSYKNDVLISVRAPVGPTNICPSESCIGRGLAAIRPLVGTSTYFLLYTLRAFEKKIADMGTGSTFSAINSKNLQSFLIPLPPLPEQHHIVAKVDQLMTLCDELEARQEKQRVAHARLNKSALHALTQSRTGDELSFNWTRIKDNFSLVFTTPESIQELRSSILQLAVQGRLVPQNPDDEPASVLLEKIRKEKKQLIKEGKIKKQKPLPEIRPEEVPFELPQGWEWCRVQDLAQLITSGSRGWAQYYSNSGSIFVTMGNLSRNNYLLNMETTRHVSPPENSEGSRTKLEENDLLISITGDVGNLGLIPRGFGEAYINQHICLLRFMPLCRNRYFPEFMRSPLATFQFEAPQRGVKNSFRLGDVGEMIIPVPPLPEQHRIVAKVDQLMALCDELESSLTRSQADGQKLMQSVVVGLSSASDQPENVQW